MDMLKNMNDAMAEIERRLGEEIDLGRIARIACCSEHHFRRMFSFLAGVTLPEYIRRRRLTLAAMELHSGESRILDLALKYGYGSPDSFARAFRELHGIMPSAARGSGVTLKAYPPLTFRLTIEGGDPMQYRIVEKEAFRIVGIMKRVPIVFAGPNPDIEAMWRGLDEERIRELAELSDTEPGGIVSASANFSEGRMEEKGGLDHYIGAATTREAPDGPASLDVAAGSWAVFETVGGFPETTQSTWGRIYSEWLPSADYEVAEGPEILWTERRDPKLPDYRSEIWIPVRRKG
ncbi:GyrI-like domain-containing protein [Saccharibacillus sp. CPCC 101409]|uniref:AraC family transcriptional regulator n=1 Tax=Saccharibacillus sp. CPCC 101409 TaxID=3058041 RepID=UPI002671371B|nr:GyrI-like domain-containing protein [Saccharibacillus sp. CPCC 101409]MDO3410017.1 GyrI-like domain-containing protein [Saccharibacillus sp. CPCC 101409]